jgi:transglutaminase-like putative cysteine protease
MRLELVHRTLYRYGDSVTTSHHEARLSPREEENQRVLSHELEIAPRPESRRRRTDYFGNRTVSFSLLEPHKSLEVHARTLIEVTRTPDLTLESGPSWEAVRDEVRTGRGRDLLSACEMTFDSPRVAASPALRALASPSFTQGRPLLACVRELNARIHRDLRYDPEATDISTPLEDVLQGKRGVCQDFAHLAIGCLRSLGLPARYVSGYLLTRPPPGKPRLIGADASHAWFATFVPGMGWVAFDPTNDVVPSDEHITVAYGRDFDDVTPIRGVILGGGQHELEVAVTVQPA